MSIFAKLKVWRVFGRIMNSWLGTKLIDSFRGLVELAMKPVAMGKGEGPPPFTRLEKSLSEARVGLVTTAGIYVEGQNPFDVDSAMGDSSFRVIPSDVDASRLRIAHTHYPHDRAEKDVNVIFPVERLRELAGEGAIGSVAASHFSYGFDLHVEELVGTKNGTAHEVARALKEEGVDVVLVTPG